MVESCPEKMSVHWKGILPARIALKGWAVEPVSAFLEKEPSDGLKSVIPFTDLISEIL